MNITVNAQLAREMGMKPDEFERLVSALQRTPTLCELGVVSAMWSEHCSYKSSKVHLRRLPTTGPRVVQGPGENAGAVDIGGGYCVVFKMESHNHPSYIEPFQGAATGVGGILRDVFTMGARPIALLDSLRFGDPKLPKTKSLVEGVVSGISHYGNCLPGDERLTFMTEGKISHLSFRDFAESFGAIEPGATVEPIRPVQVLSFDPKTQRECWGKVTRIFRRETSSLLKIKTALGRSISVTPDHPSVVIRDDVWQTIPSSLLQEGDLLPLLKQLPQTSNEPTEVDLIEAIGRNRDDIYVELPRPLRLEGEARERWMSAVPSEQKRHNYLTGQRIPLQLFLAFEKDLQVSRRELCLYRSKGKVQKIKAVIPLDESFARLVGYYLAEGCVSPNEGTYKVIWVFATHEREYIQDVCALLTQMNLRYSLEERGSATAVTASSWFLGEMLLHVLEVGSCSHEKKIPASLLRQATPIRVELLKGMLRGDGSVLVEKSETRAQPKIRYCSVSEVLANQTLMLFQELGLVASLYTKPEGVCTIQGRTHQTRRSYHIEISNLISASMMRSWFSKELNAKLEDAISRYRTTDNRYTFYRYQDKGAYYTLPIREIINEEKEQEVFDIEVEGTHLFACGSGIITHNCMGVPVVGGEATFDSAYDGNCLVNVCAVGVAKSDKLFLGYASGVGNPVFYLGAKTGRDGIHGATMASDEFNASNEKRRPTVQIGDPFREKILLECCLELMHKDLLLGIQDMGAAGLTSSSAEMAARAENGIELELSRVPTREPGMSAYEIMLSESQERMLFVAKPGKEEEVLQIAAKWDLDAVAIGVVTDTRRLIVKMNGQIEADLPISLLADDAPRYDRAKQPPSDLEARHNAPRPEAPRDLGVTLFELIAHPDVASKRWIYEQYDHQVRSATLVGPGGADAAVLRVLDPQDSSKDTGAVIALTVDCPVRSCALDPRRGAQLTIYEGARNLACVGARAIGATDCLNLGNPEKPEVTWQLSEVIDGMAEACRALGVPIVSGNVSLYNENRGKAIHPTPSVAMVGLVCEVGSAQAPTTPGVVFRRPGEHIAIIGEPAKSSLGGSLYAFAIHGQITGRPVLAQPELERRTNEAIIEMVHAGALSSAHDVSGGGLAVALSRGVVRGVGAKIELPEGPLDFVLFAEGQPVFVLSFAKEHQPTIADITKKQGLSYQIIGETGGDALVISGLGRVLGSFPCEQIKRRFENGFASSLA